MGSKVKSIWKLAGLLALMAGARYAPLDELRLWQVAGETPAVAPRAMAAAPAAAPAAPAHPVTTGSVDLPPVATATSAIDARVRDIVVAQAAADGDGAGAGPRRGPESGSSSSAAPRRPKQAEDQADYDFFDLGDSEEDMPAKPQHPLVAANPKDYVTICEAGCRPSSDLIVYRVSKAAAASAEIAKRRLEVASADTVNGQQPSPDNAVVCVAGCYDDEPTAKPKKSAAVAPEPPVAAPVHVAQVEDAALARSIKSLLRRHAQSAPHPVQAVAPQHRIEPSHAIADASAAPMKLAERHLLSTEARGRRVAKRVKAVKAYSDHWRTTIHRLAAADASGVAVSEQRQAWKSAVIPPFVTAISKEVGWEFAMQLQ